MTPLPRRARTATAGLALLAVATASVLTQLPASAEDAPAPGASLLDPDAFVTLGDTVAGLADITAPLGADDTVLQVAPTALQRRAAAALGEGVRVQWNDSGTPASIFAADGELAPPMGGDPEAVARAWVADNLPLLGIGADQARGLELVSDQPLAGGRGHAVLLRQRFGDLVPATRSMLTVAVDPDGAVAYASSSLTRADGATPTATLTPAQGWLTAARSVGRSTLTQAAVDVVSGATTVAGALTGDWTRMQVDGLDQPQLARLRAFASPDGTVRPVIEANVVDTTGGTPFAYRVMVDAVSGATLYRQNAVENATEPFGPFAGSYPGDGCSSSTPFALDDDQTATLGIAVIANPVDDVKINLTGPGGYSASSDTLTSPEAGVFSGPAEGRFPRGTYAFSVCTFSPGLGGPYTAEVVASDVAVGTGGSGGVGVIPDPQWRAFAANPTLSSFATDGPFAPDDNSVIECWVETDDCAEGEVHVNQAAFGAWDTLNGLPTFTTIGNNANTHEAWGSPLTPGGLAQAPISPVRDYTTPFTDAWNNAGCNPTNLVPGGNDIDAVTGNLFVGHNRIHDFAYALGFTEDTYNLQVNNGDRGGLGGDPEIGNVQAGAITGGSLGMYLGRDNANQIALQDGVPGITNQYLFQPIAAAFYSPCTDGSLDTGIYGHEYTHAISNRMVGGPDDGLTSEQGGAMGESWSDLVAAEYQFENDYLSDPTVAKNPWSLGSYTTGNLDKGIRDYAINDNPLNYSDYGFDITGAEVHADGEIWNGTLWEVRQALVAKYDTSTPAFPSTDVDLQERCEQPSSNTNPIESADQCPGNRRWLQLIFDSFLLQQGATDMLQARDAMLAADQVRFGGANQAEIATAFARRGMGVEASTETPADGGEDVVTPSFRSAYGANPVVRFTSAAGARGNLYVGEYEARATPVADTDPTTPLTNAPRFTPGTYRMTYVSPSQGFRRFLLTVPDDDATVTQPVDDTARNLTSAANGAAVVASASSGESLNADFLIDGTEATNWGGSVGSANIDDAPTPPAVAVSLAGGLQTISSVKVSALLRPVVADDPTGLGVPLPAGVDDDPLAGSRFTALRTFALQACTTACDDPASYRTVFVSSDDAFPGTVPRPTSADQVMRSFTFAPVQAAAVRLVALENQCTGQAAYAGEQDADPTNDTDCKTASERGQVVHAAELQVFGGPVPTDPPGTTTPGQGTPGTPTTGTGTSIDPVTGQPVPTPAPGTTPATGATGAAATPGPVGTKVRIRLPRVQQVRGKESTPMTFAVVGATRSVGKAGRAVVRLDGRTVMKRSVAVGARQGRTVVGPTYKVPTTLSFGVHKLRVRFKPTDRTRYRGAQSRKITLTVVRSRPNVR